MSEENFPVVHCAYDEMVEVNKLVPHPDNPNKHPAEQIERLALILNYQGYRKPITVSNRSGFITAGHGRLLSGKLNGYTHVPVDYQDYETEDQEIADLNADNAVALWAEIDMSIVNATIPKLGPDFDLQMLGFEKFDLDPLNIETDDDDKEAKDLISEFIIALHCETEQQQEELFEEFEKRGLSCKLIE